MERLTERLENGVIKVKYASQHETAIHRLVTIEDILGDEYDLDLLQKQIQAYREGRYIILKEPEQAGISRLRELAKADRKGRCIVLPCKKGDTVWRIVHDAAPHITKDRCTDIKYENRDIWVHLIGDRVMGGWNFGKLLFLTRADAEAALRREQDG